MKFTRIHVIALTVVAIAAVPVLYIVIDRHYNPPQVSQSPSAGEPWLEKFEAVYALRKDEMAKLIGPPFIPERTNWIAQNSWAPMQGQDPIRLVLSWNGEEFKEESTSYGRATNVGSTLFTMTRFSPDAVEIPNEILRRPMPGDWVIREGLRPSQRVAAFESELSKVLGTPTRLVSRNVERETLIASGSFVFTPSAVPNSPDPKVVHLFHKTLNRNGGTMSGDVPAFLRDVGRCLRRRVISEGLRPTDARVLWCYHTDVRPRAFATTQPSADVADEVLANVAKQTGLTFKREMRVTDVWVLDQSSQSTRASIPSVSR